MQNERIKWQASVTIKTSESDQQKWKFWHLLSNA